MKKLKSTTLGILIGAVTTLSITALADYIVAPNSFPVKVNGQTVQIDGYNINDSTYFKLRDVANAVGGFDVGFNDNTITIATEQQPELTLAPAPTPANLSASDITIVKGEDGNDYTSDGLQIYYEDNIPYVKAGYIQQRIAKKGFPHYTFAKNSLVDTANDWKPVLINIPVRANHSENILLEYYISTLAPFIDNLSAE